MYSVDRRVNLLRFVRPETKGANRLPNINFESPFGMRAQLAHGALLFEKSTLLLPSTNMLIDSPLLTRFICH